MKDWKVLTGFTLTGDQPKRKAAIFRTDSHNLAREKWRTIGKGRSRIIVDPEGHPWSFTAEMSVNSTTGFTIKVIVEY